MKHEKITYQIINCALRVHNYFGHGFLEKIYCNSLFFELQKSGFNVQKEKKLDIYYDDKLVGEYYPDLLVDNCIIIEIKTVNKIILPHILQVRNYLKASLIDTGLLFNFNSCSLEYKRIFSDLSP